MNEVQFNQVNSAEMTAYWRTSEPQISNDLFSINLVSESGIKNALKFEEQLDYHCVSRLISVRARYFYDQAVKLLKTGNYDSCISFASGFSLLNDNIAYANEFDHIKFYDSDLEHVVHVRKNRINDIVKHHNKKFIQNSKTITYDLNELLNGKPIKEVFPNIKNPLIIFEGISYFIPNSVLHELFNQLTLFPNAAIILDYFPEDSALRSQHFKLYAKNVTSFIPQIINTIKHTKDEKLGLFKIENQISVQEYEAKICAILNLDNKLMDENKFFPTEFIVLVK